MRRLLFISVTLVLLGWSSSAHAQYWANEDRPSFVLSTTTVTTATVVGAIMLMVVSVRKEPATALRLYLEQNEPAVRATFALGAGDALDDLGIFFGVSEAPELARFGRLVRRERRVLSRLAWTEGDAVAFMRHVRTAMRFDPRLRVLL